MNDVIEIILPAHSEERLSHVCPNCEDMMVPCVHSNTYEIANKRFHVSNIQAYECFGCGLILYSSTEAEMIENAIREATDA
jgi:YgiT-type zinc finger domain-containing protein